jgi:hypothetical protein
MDEMYKNKISGVLNTLHLIPGGMLERLMEISLKSAPQLKASVEEYLSGGDKMQQGAKRGHAALGSLAQLLGNHSPSAGAIELHELTVRFDSVLSEYPALESLLRPGRQALAELAGAYDVTLQQNRGAPSLFGLVSPAIELGLCYAHYQALEQLLAESDQTGTGQEVVVIEIADIDSLVALASYAGFLAHIAAIVKRILDDERDEAFASDHEIQIAAIESGSPIQITLRGSGKAVLLFLAMIRDAVRAVWLPLTPRGRTIEAMETLAKAKELGITSQEVFAKLNAAVAEASTQYAETLLRHRVSVGGESVSNLTGIISLPATEGAVGVTSGAPRLSGPNP